MSLLRRLLVLLVGTTLAASLDAAEVACTTRPGECAVLSTREGPTWGEAVVQASDTARGFSLSLTRDARTLTIAWKPPADGRLLPCTAPTRCAGAPAFDCAGAVVCGSASSTAYCGTFLSSDTIELRFRWCRSAAEPWPPWPAPLPEQKPPPPPPPPKKPVPPEDERRDPPGPKKPPAEAAELLARIREANASDRPWQADGTLATRKGLPSRVTARHVPGLTFFTAAVAGETGTEAYTAPSGWLVARRGSSGAWLEIRPDPATERPPGGGYEPTLPPSGPLPGGSKGKKKAGSAVPTPADLVAALRPEAMAYYGVETCGGARFAGLLCHRIDFPDDDQLNSAYFEEESLRLESILGADKKGPRKIVWTYDPKVSVLPPPASEIRKLTGDPQRDMAAMMAIFGQP